MTFSNWFKKRKTNKPRHLEPLIQLSRHNVADVCKDFDLQEESKTCLIGAVQPNAFLACLIDNKCYFDAVRFLAYALPNREAVWWACQCVRSVPVCFQGDEIAVQALESAEKWVLAPQPESCEFALAAGKKHSFEMPGAPAAWTAIAAACTQHELAEAEGHPEPKLTTAYASAGAITMTATVENTLITERFTQFIDLGIEIAQGKKRVPG